MALALGEGARDSAWNSQEAPLLVELGQCPSSPAPPDYTLATRPEERRAAFRSSSPSEVGWGGVRTGPWARAGHNCALDLLQKDWAQQNLLMGSWPRPPAA